MPGVFTWIAAAVIGIPLILLSVYTIFRVASLGILKSLDQFKKGKK